MLVKKIYSKYNSRLEVVWSSIDFCHAIDNFIGCLIFRGNSKRAQKYYEKLLTILKLKYRVDPLIILRNAFDNLYPLFAGSKKKFGKKFTILPTFATGNRRFVMLTNWLLRNNKGKYNTRGIKMDEVIRHIIDASENKGRAISMKKTFYKNVLSARHLLNKYNEIEEEEIIDDYEENVEESSSIYFGTKLPNFTNVVNPFNKRNNKKKFFKNKSYKVWQKKN